MTPEISVIVPVYNVEPYLRQCVDSILGQTFSDLELILVDDGSSDGSGAICDQYAQKDARVRVIHQENSGVTAARRAALDQARAAYICFVDGDDWVKENWLRTVHKCLAENGWPDTLVFSYMQDDGLTPQPLLAQPGLYDKARLEREIYPYMIWDRRKPFLTQLIPGYQCMFVIRRELLLAHYVRSDAITVHEDAATLYECLYNAASLYVCPERLYVYRRRDDSVLSRLSDDYIQMLELCWNYLTDHLVRQAPALRGQVDAFFAEKFLYYLGREARLGCSTRQAAGHLRDGLADCELLKRLSLEELPLRIRFFLWLLRRRAYLPAVLLHRLRYRLFKALHI